MAAALRDAAGTRTAVYPIGGGTSLSYGMRPDRPGLGLLTTGLNRIVDYPAGDLTITVEAGLPVAELNRRLTNKRQCLPIDVPRSDIATIGGVVTTNTFGPRCYGYGTIRDYLIGVRAIDGRGEIFSGGGRVVKNAAGYNIPRLLAGSLGTIGVVTQVTLMVRPRPEGLAFVVCDVSDFDTAECLLASLSRSQTLPVVVELLAGQLPPGGPWAATPQDAAARMIVGFDGGQAEVEWMTGRLLKEWGSAEDASLTTLMGEDAERLGDWLAEIPNDIQIHVLPSAVVPLLEEIVEQVPGVSIQAHAGNGVVGLRIGQREADSHILPEHKSGQPSAEVAEEPEPPIDGFAEIVREKLRPAAVAAGGVLTVLACPENVELTSLDIWGPAGSGTTVMRTIQEQFDPAGILNPGRFPSRSCDNAE
jgi:glycolate oxidase FAD binding subunit